MKRKSLIGLIAAGALLVGAAVWLVRSAPAPAPPGTAPSPTKAARAEKVAPRAPSMPTPTGAPVAGTPLCRFSPQGGETLAFRIEKTADSRIDFSQIRMDGAKSAPASGAAGTDVKMKVKGFLFLRYYPSSKGEWDVAGVLEDLDCTLNGVAPDYLPAIRFPFVFKMTEEGLVSDFKFMAGLSGPAPVFVTSLLYDMQVICPSDGRPAWETRETDGTGEYRAAYTAERGGAEGALSVRKRKLDYVRVAAADSPVNAAIGISRVRVEESAIVASVAASGAWVSKVEGKESTVTLAAAGEFSRGSSWFAAERVTRDPRMQFGDRFEDVLASLKSHEWLKSRYSTTDPVFDQLGASMELNQALDLFLKMRGSSDSQERRAAEKFLVNYLRQFPEACRDLIGALDGDGKRERFDHETQLLLWRLITDAGHLDAQMAVLDAIRNPQMRDLTRMRALAYVHDFEYPDRALTDGLWEVYQASDPATGDKAAKERSAMTLLAIGALGHDDKLNDALKTEIGARLLENLNDAPDSSVRTLTLNAIGNYGRADAITGIEPYLSDPEMNVRAAAYESLRRMNDPRAVEVLARNYRNESSPQVRTVALETLARMPPTQAGIEWARGELPRVEQPEGQTALVELLGKNLSQYPESEQVLRDFLTLQPSNRVKKTIYQYIQP